MSAPLAVEHGATADANGGQTDAGRAHQQGGRGFVTTHEQHHAVDWVASDAFFHVHAGQVAVEHGGGAQQRFAERHHGKLKRESASLINADLDLLGQSAEVRVAGCQFAEGVADADDRATVKLVMRNALALDPAAVGKAVSVLPPKPLLAAQLFGFFAGGVTHGRHSVGV